MLYVYGKGRKESASTINIKTSVDKEKSQTFNFVKVHERKSSIFDLTNYFYYSGSNKTFSVNAAIVDI